MQFVIFEHLEIRSWTSVGTNPSVAIGGMIGLIFGVGIAIWGFGRAELLIPTGDCLLADGTEPLKSLADWGFQSVSTESGQEKLLRASLIELTVSETADFVYIIGPRFVLNAVRRKLGDRKLS